MYLPRPVLEEVKDRDSYNNLSFEEYVRGMVRLISATYETDDATALLLGHLEMVAADAAEFKWESVRKFSNQCFDKADRREMSWRADVKIREIRIKNSWIGGPKKTGGAEPCHAFNTDGCDENDGHMERGFKARHCCTICWYVAGLKECTHPASKCNRRGELNQKQTNVNRHQGQFKHTQYQKNKTGGPHGGEPHSMEKGAAKN